MAASPNLRLVRKARGAFFTPPSMAEYMARWAIRSPSDRVLEPSCGEAVFLSATVECLRALGAPRSFEEQLVGLDIHEESVESARQAVRAAGAEATLHVGDFFDFGADRQFDAVIGNPPYVRYQNFSGSARERGLAAALAQGVRLPRLASSWAAFVIHAASFLKPEGRLALVLPAELLSVNYAAPVRRFLMERFAHVQLVVFEERVFPDVLEEVVLLLAEGVGPAGHCELYQATNLQDLDDSLEERRTWAPLESGDKWLPALIPTAAAQVYADVVDQVAFTDLLGWGETNLGMVSGNNKYFALTAKKAMSLGLTERDLLRISPPGSRHLRGLTFTERMWREMVQGGSRGYLFDPASERPSLEGLRYIREGENRGVHRAYKCRVRSPWWKVPRVRVPDLFLTYMNHDAPRLVANRARLHYLNSIHGVILRPGLRQLGMDLLPMAMLNSLTLLGAELVGRSYGGGMLKLEPKEADKLPLPSPDTLRDSQSALRALRPQLSRYLRNGELREVVKLVDRALLREHLKMRREAVERLREAREQLFQRRAIRAKGK